MTEKIILAAGCFWSVQYKLSKLKGVIHTQAVYAGGETENPSYEQVCSGETGHAEAVLVEFDNEIIRLQDILSFFFKIHDASQINRQGPDIGSQYRSAIFYFDKEQKEIAEEIKSEAQESRTYKNLVIQTQILPVNKYFLAEAYHQNYYKKIGY